MNPIYVDHLPLKSEMINQLPMMNHQIEHCPLDSDTYISSLEKTYESMYNVGDSGDSSSEDNGDNHFFEGAEKRLVLYLTDENGDDADLRKISRSAWETMLDLVNCRVLNVISNENTIAYLLSESSMFIFKNCVMIKTCGSTTLLHCLEKLLELVKMAGFEMIEDLFYSHKNLLVPSLQIQPHHSFLKESEYLDKLFNGQSHLFGHVNSDRFYLYTLNNKYRETNGNEHFKFEIIMEELDEKVMSLFVRPQPNGIMNESITASDVTRKSGIDKLIPEMVIDDYFFTPCGYSMNGLFGPYYMTIHITPESDFSYVSLEMNVPQSDYPKFIRSVLNVFKPGKFMLNLTTPDLSVITARRPNKGLYIVDDHHQPKMDQSNDSIPFIDNVHGLMLYEDLMVATFTDYRRVDLQLSHYKHSDIIYARYVIEGIS